MPAPVMKPLLKAAADAWEKYMHSKPGQHVRNMLGSYFTAAFAVQKKAAAFDDLLTACEALVKELAEIGERENEPDSEALTEARRAITEARKP